MKSTASVISPANTALIWENAFCRDHYETTMQFRTFTNKIKAMRKTRLFTVVLVSIFYTAAKAQFVYDKLGKPAYEIPYTDIGGSPYLQDGWIDGSVVTDDGKQASAKLKFDSYLNRLLFQGKNAETLEFTDKLKAFGLNISNKEISDVSPLVFVNNLPAVDKQTTDSWYQLIADGKVKLLKYYGKKIMESQGVNFSPKTKSFVAFHTYYVLRNGAMARVGDNKKAIAKALNNHGPEIEAWLKSNSINFKSDADLQKFFGWYNSLN